MIARLKAWRQRYRQQRAWDKLALLVERQRNSYAVQDYRKRRASALKATRA